MPRIFVFNFNLLQKRKKRKMSPGEQVVPLGTIYSSLIKKFSRGFQKTSSG